MRKLLNVTMFLKMMEKNVLRLKMNMNADLVLVK